MTPDANLLFFLFIILIFVTAIIIIIKQFKQNRQTEEFFEYIIEDIATIIRVVVVADGVDQTHGAMTHVRSGECRDSTECTASLLP
jgi:hypothetical protein